MRLLKQENFFNETEYDQLYPSGSGPARIYGTPKMDKFFPCNCFPRLCLIVSSAGTFNYNLARFLCDLLSPLVSNDYSSKDTFLLFLKLRMQIFPKCILLQETLDNHNPNLNITRKELKQLFHFATSQTNFISNSKFYNQIDGVAMSSPLAPVLANIFMGFRESYWFNEYNLKKPKFYIKIC